MKNKLLIVGGFSTILLIIFLIINNRPSSLTEEDARKIVVSAFGDEIEKVEDKSLVVSHNKKSIALVVGDQYIVLDTTKNPAKIFQYTSTKPPIDVKVLEIKDGKLLIEHDDHTHWISNTGNESAKVGDIISVKDPHTYID